MIPLPTHLGHSFAHAVRALVGFFLPPSCIGCTRQLPLSEPIGFCPECYGKLPWWNPSQVLKPKLPPCIKSFNAPCLYEGPLRAAILAFKFEDHTHLAMPLARLMKPLLPTGTGAPLLVPVPSHAARLRQRTYNHAALLAQKLAGITKLPVNVTALKRISGGTPQNELTRAQRQRLAGTDFTASSKAVTNRIVVLVDDIYTTGATAKACALALKRAGAAEVHVLTLAYTRPK